MSVSTLSVNEKKKKKKTIKHVLITENHIAAALLRDKIKSCVGQSSSVVGA